MLFRIFTHCPYLTHGKGTNFVRNCLFIVPKKHKKRRGATPPNLRSPLFRKTDRKICVRPPRRHCPDGTRMARSSPQTSVPGGAPRHNPNRLGSVHGPSKTVSRGTFCADFAEGGFGNGSGTSAHDTERRIFSQPSASLQAPHSTKCKWICFCPRLIRTFVPQ